MNRILQSRTSVSALLGAPVFDRHGGVAGRVREFAVAPQTDAAQVQALILRAPGKGRGELLVPVAGLERNPADGALRLLGELPDRSSAPDREQYLMLERDLLDQQIIDVHGHKVVRVNDVDLFWEVGPAEGRPEEQQLALRVAEVEVGTRGALRRLLKGLPSRTVDRLARQARAKVIPWEFVDLIDRDPSRRVRLKIEQDRLSKMHPSDLADILEELAPAEGQALFQSLDEEVAAEALEEVELKTQKQLIESLDSERVAGIIEEMDPGAAADLLSELPDERSEAILGEMNEEERHEVEELLEFEPDTAAGLMTTEYVAVPSSGTVEDALNALAAYEGDLESVSDLFLIGVDGHFDRMLPLARLLTTNRSAPLAALGAEHPGPVVSSDLEMHGRKVAELFDKYNLRCLPVLDEHGLLAGVIHAEHVIAWLRNSQ